MTLATPSTVHDANRRMRYAEAAEYLGLPVGTVRALVARGQLEHIRVGPRTVLLEVSALDEFLARHRRAAGGGR
jgi:excisionase family DNA binding protein